MTFFHILYQVKKDVLVEQDLDPLCSCTIFFFLSYEIELNWIELGNQGHTLFLPLEDACHVPNSTNL